MSVPAVGDALDLAAERVRPVRVAHIFSCLDRGGAETATLDLCRSVERADASQVAVTLGGRHGSLTGEFAAAGVDVRPCPLHPVATFPVRMWRCLRTVRPDVVVSHVNLPGGLVTAVARAAGVPVRVARIWSESDDWPDTLTRRWARGALRRLIRYSATDVLGVGRAALQFAGPSTGDRRYRVLYNGVDPARFGGWQPEAARQHLGLPSGAPVLGHVGRAVAAKNRPFLVDVHRAVVRENPGARLLLAGPGGVDDLNRARPGFADDSRVVTAGETADIAPVFAAMDVLLLPSTREGLPGVVLEALAAGVPVVANDLPSTRGVAGLVPGVRLLPLAGGPDQWAKAAMESVQTSRADRDRIAASLRSSPFVHQVVVRQWRELWRC